MVEVENMQIYSQLISNIYPYVYDRRAWEADGQPRGEQSNAGDLEVMSWLVNPLSSALY